MRAKEYKRKSADARAQKGAKERKRAKRFRAKNSNSPRFQTAPGLGTPNVRLTSDGTSMTACLLISVTLVPTTQRFTLSCSVELIATAQKRVGDPRPYKAKI